MDQAAHEEAEREHDEHHDGKFEQGIQRHRGEGQGHTHDHQGMGQIDCEVDPLLWNPESFGLTHRLLIGKRTDIAECGVPSNPIVEALQILKDGLAGLPPSLERQTAHTFPFQGPEKGFGHRIIVTVAGAAHAHHDAGSLYCTGYLGHPFKNTSCEMEKVLHSLLANIGGLVYNQTSGLSSSCSNDTILM